jgi:hypothetical protein
VGFLFFAVVESEKVPFGQKWCFFGTKMYQNNTYNPPFLPDPRGTEHPEFFLISRQTKEFQPLAPNDAQGSIVAVYENMRFPRGMVKTPVYNR